MDLSPKLGFTTDLGLLCIVLCFKLLRFACGFPIEGFSGPRIEDGNQSLENFQLWPHLDREVISVSVSGGW